MKERAQSYRDLDIFVLAKELAVKVHKMTLEELGAKLFNFREAVIKGHRAS
jgi:hypothetical protein